MPGLFRKWTMVEINLFLRIQNNEPKSCRNLNYPKNEHPFYHIGFGVGNILFGGKAACFSSNFLFDSYSIGIFKIINYFFCLIFTMRFFKNFKNIQCFSFRGGNLFPINVMNLNRCKE